MGVVEGHNLGDGKYHLLLLTHLRGREAEKWSFNAHVAQGTCSNSKDRPVSCESCVPPSSKGVYLWSSTVARSPGKEQPQNLASHQCSEEERPKPWSVNLQYLYFCYEPELVSEEQPGCLKQRNRLDTFL